MPPPKDLISRLETRWRALAAELGWADSSTEVFDDLISRYREPHRRYHSVTHVESVLAVLDDLSAPGSPAVDARLAAWFHDAVYDPMSGDNEERSAELAGTSLGRLGVGDELVASVSSLVLATKTHDGTAGPHAAVLLDADLSILGADEETYDRYASDVRSEFSAVPDELFCAGRTAVLAEFVERAHLFMTPRGRERFEDAARANVAREVSRLRAGPRVDRTAEWDALRRRHLRPPGERPASSARGVHHVALLCHDVETTIAFYQGLLEFPLTELFENRDLEGSTHFFFDIGHGNALAFFDMPGLDLGPYAEVLGGLHHLAISVEPVRWEHLKARLDEASVEYSHVDGTSIYFLGPDHERIELIADPLGEMYGSIVL